MKMLKNKKGYTVSDLLPLTVAFVVVAIALSMGAEVLSEVQAGQTSATFEYNASQNGLESLDEKRQVGRVTGGRLERAG